MRDTAPTQRPGLGTGTAADREDPAGLDAAPADGCRTADPAGLVIPGAGPGERPTLRLRDSGPEEPSRYAPEWLELREGPDGAARADALLEPLRVRLAELPGGADGLVIHDLGCGTGSMGRWLAPRLAGAQHWILHDRDPYLLHFAAAASPRAAADGSRVTVETRRGDVARLTPESFTGASLVTASALLDVLTREEVETLVAACTGAGSPALLTLSVAGRVELSPSDPLDGEIAEAFNAHQKRGDLLGPDAITVACEAFSARGATVRVHPSPWRLGADESALTAQWLRGWVGAAVEQRPELRGPAERYLRERLAACAAGELRVVVHHSDVLTLPRTTDGVHDSDLPALPRTTDGVRDSELPALDRTPDEVSDSDLQALPRTSDEVSDSDLPVQPRTADGATS
ncbi:class I SAM-dependent methyltransferase [Streptomyces sp. NPDC126514]|uniref:class I SAM-dependent methyltransferase n=1 Tax=Streptomyces sp. NPDC126514 TaxID=3155210 RepID=UPI0033257374